MRMMLYKFVLLLLVLIHLVSFYPADQRRCFCQCSKQGSPCSSCSRLCDCWRKSSPHGGDCCSCKPAKDDGPNFRGLCSCQEKGKYTESSPTGELSFSEVITRLTLFDGKVIAPRSGSVLPGHKGPPMKPPPTCEPQ